METDNCKQIINYLSERLWWCENIRYIIKVKEEEKFSPFFSIYFDNKTTVCLRNSWVGNSSSGLTSNNNLWAISKWEFFKRKKKLQGIERIGSGIVLPTTHARLECFPFFSLLEFLSRHGYTPKLMNSNVLMILLLPCKFWLVFFHIYGIVGYRTWWLTSSSSWMMNCCCSGQDTSFLLKQPFVL